MTVVPRYHDGWIKRLSVPAAVRRAVALRSGAVPGETTPAECAYCGAPGAIRWPVLYFSGRPGSWVAFDGLSLDHIEPYSLGGSNTDPDNFALACPRCNSSKGTRSLTDWTGVAR